MLLPAEKRCICGLPFGTLEVSGRPRRGFDLTISRLRAGLAVTFAAVSLMAGAQAAEACTEPTLGDLPARGEENQLVRFELAGVTPGSEYLVKVHGRERKSGVATTDKVSKRFRMPHLGDSNRRVKVEVVIAHDGCETSPWKLEEKMTYRPAPAPPVTQVEPTPTPAPAPDPSPPPAPSPPAAPSITDSAPAPKSVDPPAVPKSSVTPTTPTPPAVTEPAKEGRAWITPTDPYQKLENAPPKLNDAALARTDRPSDPANSTAALVGLGGIFLLLAGTVAIGWTRFRRYDDQRLDEILNPEGKLPTHLDPEAKDTKAKDTTAKDVGKKPRKPGRKPLPGTPRRGGGGVLADLSDEQKASMSDEELDELRAQFKKERKAARKKRRKAVLPTFDPTDPAAAAAAAAGAAAAASGAEEQVDPTAADATSATPAKPADPPPPAEATERPAAEQPGHTVPNGKPPPQAVPPIPVPHVNGGPHGQGGGEAGNAPPAHRSYREQVETELQRILDDAGLHTEVDGILADAKAEAQRQGVPIDSELMLRALCEDTNGAAQLSDSAKGELESRFKRIVAEERGERGPTPGS